LLSNENFVAAPLPTIVFNRGASSQLSNHIQALGKTSALIVTDKNLAASGVLDPIIEGLKAANLRVEVFDGVEPNPTDQNVQAGAEMLKELGDACVIPIGGGSSMDCGKSVALLAENGTNVQEMQASVPAPATAPVIAVPTTAGTGSETNSACVITNTTLGRKTYVMHPSIVPAFAVLDPDLTVGLPTYPTATCGYDVLTHAIEAFVSNRANAYSDSIALDAIRKVAGNLRKVVQDGSDVEARSQMLLGSAQAAMAFNVAGLGSVHGTGHAISARLNAAHGQTLATMLPHVMEFNMPEREEKYIEVAKILAPNGPATGAGAIDAAIQLRADIGIDKSIRDLGGEDDLLATLVEDAVADPVNFSNPIPVDAAAIEKMYKAAW
jgi:alcohol dehydrogenase class IV